MLSVGNRKAAATKAHASTNKPKSDHHATTPHAGGKDDIQVASGTCLALGYGQAQASARENSYGLGYIVMA